MAEIYGHRWTSAYGDNPDQGAALTWGKGLETISPAQLAQGLTTAIASSDAWPPSLPEFRSMCLGIPTLAAVKQELRKSDKLESRSPFLRQVWSFVDGYLFARADAEKADRMLRDAYALAAEYVMRGGHLPEAIAGAIEQQKPEKPIRASTETARKHMDEINSWLSGKAQGEQA